MPAIQVASFDTTPRGDLATDKQGDLNALGVYIRGQLLETWLNDRKRRWDPIWLRCLQNFRTSIDTRTWLPDEANAAEGRVDLTIGLTKRKVIAAYSRLLDIVFTSPDNPWSVKHSPVVQGARRAIEKRLKKSGTNFDLAFATAHGIDLGKADLEAELMAMVDEEAENKAEQDAPLITRHLADVWAEGDYEQIFKIGQLIKAIYGTGIYKGPVPITISDYTYSSGSLKRFSRDILELYNLDLYSYVIDSFASQAGPRYSRGEAHIETMDANGLRNLARNLGWSKETLEQALATGGTSNGVDDMTDRVERDEELNKGQQGKRPPGYEVAEYWGRVPPEFLKVLDGTCEYDDLGVDESAHDEDLEYEAKVFIVNRQFTPSAEHNPLRPVRRPFTLDPWEVVPGTPYGRGMGENLFGIHEGLQSAFRLFMDNKALVGSPPVVVQAERVKPGYRIEMAPFAIWPIDGPVKDAFEVVKIPDVTQSLLELITKLEDIADEDSGVNRYTSGDSAKSLNQTARGISILTSRSDQQIRGAIEGLDRAIEKVMTASYHWLRETDAIPGAVLDYKLVAQGSKSLMAREQQIQQLTQYLTLAGKALPPQTVIAILRKLYSYFGEDDVDDLFPKEEDLDANAPTAPPAGPAGAGPGAAPVPGGVAAAPASPASPAGPVAAVPQAGGLAALPAA